MPNFRGKTCVLCPRPSTRVGEHVIPRWLITDYHGEGPFKSENAGRPYLKRDGDVLVNKSLPGVHVPMCSDCNRLLGTKLEEVAKPVVRRLLPWSAEHAWPVVTADEAAAIGKWLLKVGLLWAHPESVPDQEQVQRDPGIRRFQHVEPEWLDWLRDSGDPPDGLTLYVSRRSLYSNFEGWPGRMRRIELPRFIRVCDRELRFVSREFSCIRGLDCTLVWHPGWPIEHPLVAEGKAAVLWPNPTTIDFAALQEVYVDEFGFETFYPAQDTTEDSYRRWTAKHPLTVGASPVIFG